LEKGILEASPRDKCFLEEAVRDPRFVAVGQKFEYIKECLDDESN